MGYKDQIQEILSFCDRTEPDSGVFSRQLNFPVCAIPDIQLRRCSHLQRVRPPKLKGRCNALVSETNSLFLLGKKSP